MITTIVGSGEEPDDKNILCEQMYCWCLDSDGNKIEDSKVYAQRPDCSSLVQPVRNIIPAIPVRIEKPTVVETGMYQQRHHHCRRRSIQSYKMTCIVSD